MENQILEYLGHSHASYIHARGKIATYKLLELLEPKEGEKILEIGTGTGASLVHFATQSKAHYFGYEISPLMYQKAYQRVQFCGMEKKISLSLLEKKNCFPVADNTFNKVFAESILAIQEGGDFKNLLLEIKRVLKPNGILLFNETIWLKTTSKNKVALINERCKDFFNIIQSNEEYLHLEDWIKILNDLDFNITTQLKVDNITYSKKQFFYTSFRSAIFMLIGKIKANFSPPMRKKWKRFKADMQLVSSNSEKLMEGIIIKANNIK